MWKGSHVARSGKWMKTITMRQLTIEPSTGSQPSKVGPLDSHHSLANQTTPPNLLSSEMRVFSIAGTLFRETQLLFISPNIIFGRRNFWGRFLVYLGFVGWPSWLTSWIIQGMGRSYDRLIGRANFPRGADFCGWFPVLGGWSSQDLGVSKNRGSSPQIIPF